MRIVGYSKEYTDQMLAIQSRYEKDHPYAERFTADDLKNPLLNGRGNILLAINERRVLGFSRFLSRQNFSRVHFHHIWLDINVADSPATNLMSLLFEASLPLISESTNSFFPAAGTRICVRIAESEKAKRDFFSSLGFTRWKDFNYMERDLKDEVVSYPLPEGLSMSRLRPRKEPEIINYLRAEQSCFPDSPLEYKYLHYFFNRPYWKKEGVILAALDAKSSIAGSVMIYPDRLNNEYCFTEEIFVVEKWRGKRLARALVSNALDYLRKAGKRKALLSVTSDRLAAKRIYEDAGFTTTYSKEVLSVEI